MKYPLNLLTIILLLVAFGCQKNPQTQTVGAEVPSDQDLKECNWDVQVSTALSKALTSMWQLKWEIKDASGNIAQIPDSFIVDRKALTDYAGDHCGFRVYYGLSQPGDMGSMGLIFTTFNDLRQDIQKNEDDSVLYTNLSKTDFLNIDPKGDKPKIPVTFIPISKAKEYNTNWNLFHGICKSDMRVGNNTCDRQDVVSEISPMGALSPGITQFVPLSIGIASKSIFPDLENDEVDYDGIIFVNTMFPTDEKGRSLIKNESDSLLSISTYFMYDFIIRGFEIKQLQTGFILEPSLIEEVKDESGTIVAKDHGCICETEPWCCGCCLIE